MLSNLCLGESSEVVCELRCEGCVRGCGCANEVEEMLNGGDCDFPVSAARLVEGYGSNLNPRARAAGLL